MYTMTTCPPWAPETRHERHPHGIRHCLHHTSSCFIRDSTYDADGDEERETKHEDGEDKTLLYPTPDVRVALRQRATH